MQPDFFRAVCGDGFSPPLPEFLGGLWLIYGPDMVLVACLMNSPNEIGAKLSVIRADSIRTRLRQGFQDFIK